LPEIADRKPFRHRNLAVVGSFLANQDAEQRRLTGAVGSAQADFFTRFNIDEDQLPALLLLNIREGDHPETLR